jgi:serine phosphatase RsbU (regulator of sigma subunit)
MNFTRKKTLTNGRVFGLAAKLYLAIGGAVAFTSAASIVAWLSFVELGSQQRNIATIHLPAIVNSLRLAQQSAEIAASAPLLLTAEKETDRAEILKDLSDLQTHIVTILDLLELSFKQDSSIAEEHKLTTVRENDARFAAILEALAENINRHDKLKHLLDQTVEQAVRHHQDLRHSLVQQIDDRVFYVSTGYRHLDQQEADPESQYLSSENVLQVMALSELSEESNRLLALLTESSIVHQIPLLAPLRERINASLEGSARALSQLGSSSMADRRAKAAILASLNSLKRLSVDGGNIPALRALMLEELTASRALVLDGRSLAATIAGDVHQIVESVQSRANESVMRTEDSIDLGQKLLLLINMAALLGAVAIGAVYIRRAFTEPVSQLTKTAAEFEKGHFKPEMLKEHADRTDEFGTLVRTFTNMGHEVQARTERLDEMVVERTKELNTKKNQLEGTLRKFEEELDMAQKMQHSILPHRFEGGACIDVFADMYAAREVGGDFYDFMDFRNGKYGIVIADVSDKGVTAALMMAGCLPRLRSLAYRGLPPAEVMSKLNIGLSENNDTMMFVTTFYGVIDTNNNTLTYTNAGHEEPVLMKKGGEMDFLPRTKGMALGVSDMAVYEENTVALDDDDALFCYTDGITDAINSQGEQYGVDQLQQILSGLPDRNARQICEMVISSVGGYTGETDQFDDITCLAVRYKHAGEKR